MLGAAETLVAAPCAQVAPAFDLVPVAVRGAIRRAVAGAARRRPWRGGAALHAAAPAPLYFAARRRAGAAFACTRRPHPRRRRALVLTIWRASAGPETSRAWTGAAAREVGNRGRRGVRHRSIRRIEGSADAGSGSSAFHVVTGVGIVATSPRADGQMTTSCC